MTKSLFKYTVTLIFTTCLLVTGFMLPAKPIKAAEYITAAYEFNTDGDMERWLPNRWGLESYNVSGGSLNIKTASDAFTRAPAWYAPWPTNLNTDIFNEVVVRMKTDKGHRLRMNYVTNQKNEWVTEEVSVTPDGQYHEYRFKVGANEVWRGTVLEMYFDLLPNRSAPTDWDQVKSANISIDYVHFTMNIIEKPVERGYEFNTDGDMERWLPNRWGLASYNVSGGSLNLQTSDNDFSRAPAWYAPWPTNLIANTVDEIVLRMKTDKGNSLRINYVSNQKNEWVTEEIPIISDGQYHEYRFDVGAYERWTGTIIEIYFDILPEHADPMDYSLVHNANISIDYVHFMQKPPSTPYEFYAAPDGSGSECSQANPCSLVGARNKVRTVSYSMSHDITVYLLDGTYKLSSSFQFMHYDSGRNGYNIIYKAAPGANPILSGGDVITDWELYDSEKNIYRAPTPGNFKTRQLYVDGVRATRAMGETSPEGWENIRSIGYSSASSSSSEHTEFVQIDLGSERMINSVKLYPRTDKLTTSGGSPNFPVDFTIEGSTDGATYSVLTTVTNQANPQGAAQDYTFGAASVRYLKLNVTKLGTPVSNEQGAHYLQLSELEVRGENGVNLALHKNVTVGSSNLDDLYWGKEKLTDGIKTAEVAYEMPDATMSNWKNINDIEIAIMRNWQIDRALIKSIDGPYVTMERNTASQNEKPTWIENAYELLDTPGEWYLDRTGAVDEEHGMKYFYYIPLDNQDMSSVEVISPTNEHMESLIVGTGTLDLPIHNIVIQGLTFSHSTWTFPSSIYGYPDVQAGIYTIGPSNRKPPSAVSFTYANSIMINRNIFRHLGGSGLDISRGSYNNKVKGNLFEDISSTAIWIGSNDDHHMYDTGDSRYIVKDNTVTNNYITNIGVEYLDAVGIFSGYTEHSVIEHNEIFNVPYSGISVGWGWGAVDYPNDPTVAKENVIRNNLVHHVMRSLYDGGAIYTQGAQPNSIISGNWVHHTNDPTDSQGYKNQGIYLDNGTQYYTVQDNVVQYTPNWLFMNDNQNNTAHSNYSDTPNHQVSRNTNVVNATVVTDGNWPLAAMNIMNQAGLESGYQDIKLKSAGGTVKAFERRYTLQSDSHALSFGLDPEIINFHIAGQSGASRINKKTRSVQVFMPTGSDITAVAPEIHLLNGYSIEPQSQQVQDFTMPVVYTVRAPEGTLIPWTVYVTVLDDMYTGPDDTEFVSLNPYLEDVSNWTGDITAADGTLTVAPGIISTYKGQKFGDELLEFYMELPLVGPDWMGFNLRDKYPNTIIFDGNTSYHFAVKRDVWELQKWVGGAREMLIGQFEAYIPRWGNLENTQFHSNTKHKIQAGAINVPEGVRLVLYVDGQRIFDVIDTVDPISEPGYLTIYPMSGPIKISKIEVNEAPALQSLTLNDLMPQMTIGKQQQSAVSATYSDLSTKDVTSLVLFSSSNPQVVEVTSTGVLQALKPGTAIIKAVYDGKETTAQVVVQATLDTMQSHVEQYSASGGINVNVAADLTYRLNIIQILLNQGAKAIATAYMQDFLLHINDQAVRQMNLISDVAAGILNMEGNALIHSWSL